MRWTPLPDRADILSTGAAPRKARRSPTPASTSSRSSTAHLVPLVQRHNGRAARDADALGQPLVLVRRPDGGVDDQDGDVGPLEGAQRPHGRVLLGAAVRLGRAAQAGGVDEAHRPVGRLDHRVDGVARRARHVVHDGALLAQELVEERRLAHVGPADDGDARRAGVPVTPGAAASAWVHRAASFVIGQRAPGSSATTSSRRSPVPRPCRELTGKGSPRPRETNSQTAGVAAGAVDLVDHEPHRWAGPPDHLGRRQVLLGDAGRHVDHHEDDVGLGEGPLGLVAHLGSRGRRPRRASRRCP